MSCASGWRTPGWKGGSPYKWSLLFPGDAARGRVLRPGRELSRADLAARGFDPHASVALALDYLRERGTAPQS